MTTFGEFLPVGGLRPNGRVAQFRPSAAASGDGSTWPVPVIRKMTVDVGVSRV